MAYKALYNMNLVKKKEKKARDAALQGEILSFQDESLATHFPQAVSVPLIHLSRRAKQSICLDGYCRLHHSFAERRKERCPLLLK